MNSAQSLDIDVINIQQVLISNRISLYRALSTGWSAPSTDDIPQTDPSVHAAQVHKTD